MLGPDKPGTLKSMDTLAGVLDDESRYAEAEKVARDNVERRTRVRGAEDRDTLDATRQSALILVDQGHYAEAEPLNRKYLRPCASQVWACRPGDDCGGIGVGGQPGVCAGKLAEAEKAFRDVLQEDLATLGRGTTAHHWLRAQGNLGAITPP